MYRVKKVALFYRLKIPPYLCLLLRYYVQISKKKLKLKHDTPN